MKKCVLSLIILFTSCCPPPPQQVEAASIPKAPVEILLLEDTSGYRQRLDRIATPDGWLVEWSSHTAVVVSDSKHIWLAKH